MTFLWRGSGLQRARLVSGLLLFVFAATHFLNHALGLVSLAAMNALDEWRIAIIRSWPGTVVLGGALLVHVALALIKVARRGSLRMPLWEAAQIVMGLAIPVLLLPHIVNTRIATSLFGVQDTYAYELAHIWTAGIVGQTTLMLLVWVHGCMGLHYWLRLSSGYAKAAPLLFAVAVLLPFAAFTGVSVQGRALQASLADPGNLAALKAETKWPDDATADRILTIRTAAVNGFLVLLAATGLVLVGRTAVQRRGTRITVNYLGGPTVGALPGETLLDVSRRAGIPHLSVCGGRGRCSTCRVMVVSGSESLDPPSLLEAGTLSTINAGPGVRLACQTRPRADLTVSPLLKAGGGVALLPEPQTGMPTATERELAVMFVDMRGFTALTERKLAFDVVFILNQFFDAVGKPVYDCGGWIANYAGDGAIALFADDSNLGDACRSALLAAAQIDLAVGELNKRITRELQQPIGIAIGLHAGPHVMGRIGFGQSQAQSVIGLAINVASRLEGLAKEAGVQIAMSKEVALSAGLDVTNLHLETCDVRGLEQPIGVVFLEAARDITRRLRPLTDNEPARAGRYQSLV